MNGNDQATMRIALIRDVFFDRDPAARLAARLEEAKQRGADLAILPEIPLNPWSPATKRARDDDAEPSDGPRATMQRDAARRAGIGLIGGAIVRDPATGTRHNTALIIDAAGRVIATYAKTHIPEEPGFWESSHYEPGDVPSPIVDAFPMRLGVQICSDINRPEGCHILGAMGAEVIVGPRATEAATYEKWRYVFIANALTSGAYVLSVNRPAPEQDVLIGGPSIAVAPTGEVLCETTDPLAVVTLDRGTIGRARLAYPGYLPVRTDLYARAWAAAPERGYGHHERPANTPPDHAESAPRM